MVVRKPLDIIIENLNVYFKVAHGYVRAVDDVSVSFKSGQITGLIGESGCGKSVLGLSLLGLLPSYAESSGQIFHQGMDIMQASIEELRLLRGRQIGLIPQNPGDSLNPVRKIWPQLNEILAFLEKDRKKRKLMARELLESFGFSDPERILSSYPFELSGGMQQRVLSAMGIASSPDWVLADEPSKGLDLELREQVYENLLKVRESGVEGMLLITHDLVMAEKICDQAAIMYSGQIVESGSDLLENPLHPYTRAFLAALPENGLQPLAGQAPAPWEDPPGCKFASRCPKAFDVCFQKRPDQYNLGERKVRCFLYA